MSTVGATATTDMSFRWPLAFGRPPLPPPCVATGGGNPSVASTAGVSMRRCFSDQHCNRFSTSLLAELSTKLSCPAAPNVAPMELLSLPCLRRVVHLPLSRTGLAEMAGCRDGRLQRWQVRAISRECHTLPTGGQRKTIYPRAEYDFIREEAVHNSHGRKQLTGGHLSDIEVTPC